MSQMSVRWSLLLLAGLQTLSASNCSDTLAQTPSPIKDCATLIASSPCGSTSWGTEVNIVCMKSCGLCECEDTLSQTPSPIKDCATLIATSPCGSNSWGTDVNKVCQKTCGLCGTTGMLNDDTTSTTAAPNGPHVVRLSPPFQSGEYTDFTVTAAAIDITTVIPVDTDWFGFHFFRYDSTPGDPKAALGYNFKLHPDGQVTHRSFWMSYFGPTASTANLNLGMPVWECTEEAETLSNSKVCRYNKTRREGDFMVGTSGVTLGMRPQDPIDQDIEVLSTTSDGTFRRIRWRRSRYAPFDKDILQVRYASAPMSLISSGVQTVLGYKYHGAANRYSSELTLSGSSSLEPTSVNGLVQHRWLSDNVIQVGGAYGWNNPPPGAHGYADIDNATVGSSLVFTYVGFHDVALFPSAAALADCDVSGAVLLGGNWDSPFGLMLNQSNVGQLFVGTSGLSSNGEPLQCNWGCRFTVTVVGPIVGAARTSTREPTVETSQGSASISFSAVLVAATLAVTAVAKSQSP